MKRRTYAHARRRTNRPAILKRQILRRKAQKRAKYPLHIVYRYRVTAHRIGNRGAENGCRKL